VSQTPTKTHSNRRFILTAVLLVVIVAVAALAFTRLTNTPAPVEQVEGVTVVEPPIETADFTLTSASGAPLSRNDLEGKLTLLFFGYTHCPDFCPNTLDEFRRIRTMLGDRAEDVQFVFISVDGERDTPERIAEYLDVRGVADFVTGLTGDAPSVQAAGAPFGLFFERNRTTTSAEAYLVDHSTQSFLLGRDGKLRVVFSYSAPPDVIAEAIQRYL
jgi:protein SCO1/2